MEPDNTEPKQENGQRVEPRVQSVVRFLLFAGHGYYPHGGTFDLHGKFEFLEDAKTWIENNHDKVHNSYTDVWADIMLSLIHI